MSGLILKDLLNLKKQGKLFILMAAIYALMAFFMEMSMIFIVFVIVGAMLPVTALSYDERAHWDKLALTMPVTRTQLAVSKYLLGVVLSAAGCVFCGIITVISSKPDELQEGLIATASVFFLALLMLAVMMPILYKYGTEKFRMVMILVFLLPTLLIALISKYVPLPTLTDGQVTMLLIAAAVMILAVFFLSIWLSVGIVKKKEY